LDSNELIMLFTNCTSCVQDIGDKHEVSKSNNNNKMTETTTTSKKKKIEEEEEYGGLKVLHECKFEVGNHLLNLKEKNTVKMNVDNTRIEQINEVKHS